MPPHNIQILGPKKAKTCVILTHGAGESSDSAFLTYFAEKLAEQRHRVVRFDFPYMVQRSTTGRRRPPDKEDVLLQTWRDVIKQVGAERFAIGGKSMGGRMATLIADECAADGVVCLGYPFHPSGRPDKLRIEHLQTIEKRVLIVQGERDPFGTREEVESFTLSPSIRIHWVPEGDHSLELSRGSDRNYEQNRKNAVRAIESFLFELWPTTP
ncbi:alpha/beta fold hydrolase [Planctomicrobium sp. SH664]|uniref:alpha/beta fold hydrolase n=1 Tax=Planctomicrobium sp. SH664 TaxID=3448125 RepID=UPI003F5B88F0